MILSGWFIKTNFTSGIRSDEYNFTYYTLHKTKTEQKDWAVKLKLTEWQSQHYMYLVFHMNSLHYAIQEYIIMW